MVATVTDRFASVSESDINAMNDSAAPDSMSIFNGKFVSIFSNSAAIFDQKLFH